MVVIHTATLKLNVLIHLLHLQQITACDSYDWNGQTYTIQLEYT